MTDKKMNTYGMIADLSNFSGWSDAPCETCGRKTTNAQYGYSMRVYKKPLCRACQRLERYQIGGGMEGSKQRLDSNDSLV